MYCECGCGNITKIAKRSDKRKGWIKGQSFRCLYGHSPLKKSINYKGVDKWIMTNQNKHLCNCGCGEYIKIATHHYSVGIPRYILGHYMTTPEMKAKSREMCCKRIGELSPRWKENRDEVRGRIRCKVDFTKLQKRDIFIRDKGICQDCGILTLIDAHTDHPEKTNIDHIIAVEDGGMNIIVNGQVLCLKCHKKKHSAIENRMNSGKPRTGNPEPSVQSTKVQRLLECSDTLNNQISVRLERDDIVQAL